MLKPAQKRHVMRGNRPTNQQTDAKPACENWVCPSVFSKPRPGWMEEGTAGSVTPQPQQHVDPGASSGKLKTTFFPLLVLKIFGKYAIF